MKEYNFFLLLLIGFLLAGCDLEKFTGYDHDAQPVPNSARIYGKITNRFTGEPVEKALIRIGEQATFSDANGAYDFFYFLAEDDERNRPNRLTISASKYNRIDTSLVIFPENRVNKKMEYAAPIITRIALVGGICQAEIFDYQGFEDISTVYGSFYYGHYGERLWTLNTSQALTRVHADPPNTAYFETVVPEEIPGFGLLKPFFKIFAQDRRANSDSTSYENSGVDTLFIPLIR